MGLGSILLSFGNTILGRFDLGDHVDQSASMQHRSNIIASVTSPLALFALVILVIEGLLGVFAARATGADFTFLVYGMVGSLVLLILIFAFLLLFQRTSILDTLSSAADKAQSAGQAFVITLAAPNDMQGFDLANVSWDHQKCLARCADKEAKIKPAFGAGATFEVRLPAVIVKVASDTEPVELELTDQKGNKWRVRPFFLAHRSVALSCVTSKQNIIDSYGGAR